MDKINLFLEKFGQKIKSEILIFSLAVIIILTIVNDNFSRLIIAIIYFLALIGYIILKVNKTNKSLTNKSELNQKI
ncbi:MAG: hypothetical protein ACP5IC_01835 [Minisyncoccia bacterium]